VRVYSPRAGIPVRGSSGGRGGSDPFGQTEALTTKVNAWETLTFDFANQVAGTAALNLTYDYNRPLDLLRLRQDRSRGWRRHVSTSTTWRLA